MKDLQLVGKLNEEVREGHKAQTAYELFLKGFIEIQRQQCYNQFISVDSDESALFIKQYAGALTALETELLSTIDSGNMAKQQLEAMSNE